MTYNANNNIFKKGFGFCLFFYYKINPRYLTFLFNVFIVPRIKLTQALLINPSIFHRHSNCFNRFILKPEEPQYCSIIGMSINMFDMVYRARILLFKI